MAERKDRKSQSDTDEMDVAQERDRGAGDAAAEAEPRLHDLGTDPQSEADARVRDEQAGPQEGGSAPAGAAPPGEQGAFMVDAGDQQPASSLDPGLANMLPPDRVTGDMKEDARRALTGE
jgi:hypothetical protein